MNLEQFNGWQKDKKWIEERAMFFAEHISERILMPRSKGELHWDNEYKSDGKVIKIDMYYSSCSCCEGSIFSFDIPLEFFLTDMTYDVTGVDAFIEYYEHKMEQEQLEEDKKKKEQVLQYKKEQKETRLNAYLTLREEFEKK
jgi:hypothetical protein